MQHDEASATKALDELELRLAQPPSACLGVREDAPLGDVCEAFMRLAHAAHPRWFATVSSDTKRRATRCYRDLREAYWSLLAHRCDGAWVADAPSTDGAITRRLRRS
jgi:hypothetical protein